MVKTLSYFRRVLLYGTRIALALVLLFAVFGFLCPTNIETARADRLSDSGADSSDSETDTADDFDLERCQRYCVGGPGGSNVMAGQVGSCIQDCNDRAWKAYDKRMQRLK